MKTPLLLFSVLTFNSLNCMFIEFTYNCDFSFGDPSWNYSHVFFDRDFYMDAGEKQFDVYLQKDPGEMVSYVCVHIEGTPKENAIVDFVAFLETVTIKLKTPADNEVFIHILAKEHGY